MPARFRVKKFGPESIYHIYNRGIDGREVFCDQQDFEKMLQLLKAYLSKSEANVETIFKLERPYIREHRVSMNLEGELEMMAYCLMSDHLHFLVWQRSADGITKLMRRLMTAYVMYFNRKYKRTGPLFENVYRGVVVDEDQKVLQLSKFIHLNPVVGKVKRYGIVETVSGVQPEYYLYSSYKEYLYSENPGIVNKKRVMAALKSSGLGENSGDYRKYVELESKPNWEMILRDLTLE